MAKLTKQQAKLHEQAQEMLQQPTLSYDEKLFVLDNWQESARHVNSVAGAFFTPRPLARDLAMEADMGPVRNANRGIRDRTFVDLCAGIGSLAFAVWEHSGHHANITCVEINPDYVEVGKKILPEARWVRASVFDYSPAPPLFSDDAKPFDVAISNPPFGRVKSDNAEAPRYTGGDFELKVIDIAEKMATDGVFILPQSSLPFQYSGNKRYEKWPNQKYENFASQTGITLAMNCGIDTSIYADQWKFIVPKVEIALGFGREY